MLKQEFTRLRNGVYGFCYLAVSIHIKETKEWGSDGMRGHRRHTLIRWIHRVPALFRIWAVQPQQSTSHSPHRLHLHLLGGRKHWESQFVSPSVTEAW